MLVDVDIDDRNGQVDHVWTGLQAQWPFARGASGPAIDGLQIVLLAAALLFLLPFIDPRRPFRIVHLDLLVLLAFGVSHLFFIHARIDWAMPLVYPPLLYLLGRLLWLTFRGDRRPSARLIPWATSPMLAIGLAVLVAGHITYNMLSGFGVWDGGYDSVWGADTISGGWDLYVRSAYPLNVYGPVTYLAYVPFELLFPLGPGWQHNWLPAAHAATLTFDLLTILGLFVLGRRMRPGAAGTRLGLAFAWAWAAFPYTFLVLGVSTNDFLIPALVVWALVLAHSPAGRGALVALACSAKLYPLPLLAPFARGPRDTWPRSQLLYTVAVAAVLIVSTVPYLPHPGGLTQFLDLTAGSTLDRQSPFSVWGLHPSLEWLRRLLPAATAALALVLTFRPRRRSVTTLAGAAAALIIADELFLTHWFYLYISWFAAPALVVLLSQLSTGAREPSPVHAAGLGTGSPTAPYPAGRQ